MLYLTVALARGNRKPTPGDVRLTVAVLVLGTLGYLIPGELKWGLGRFLLESAAALPLLWRQRFPIEASLASGAVTLLITAIVHPAQPFPYAVLVCDYTIGSELRGVARNLMIALFLTGNVVAEILHKQLGHPEDFFITFFLSSSAILLGVLASTQRAYTRVLEERAAVLEKDRESALQKAAAEERARIARDMHDVVGHAVALMVVQAEAGPLYLRSQPDKAEAAFDAISVAGRDALAQLRRLLGVLKVEGDSTAARAPQPTLGSLPELVDRVRQGGLDVAFSETGTSLPLAGDAETAVFRLVQEALTNTIKHAGATRAEVLLEWASDGLRIAVSDNGRGAQSVSRGDPDELSGSGGHGLIGLRERLAAVGGTLSVEPSTPGSGFTLAARIPAGA